ncbi:hypothetical protein EMPS_05653 [Entomortierella parvispora]|uniref:FAD-binding domain-containing protein n=1 Tax=Entomortierella parvispora TaxID=205924 RepID=A0A9P3HB59_9FUNG|nr:hypothetical protein EMPS_05653 [Entomortierella parvispora]
MSLNHIRKPILIIGAGIAGLSLARTLAAHSIPAIVFDDASETRRQGFGVTLRSWGYDSLLKRAGVTAQDFQETVATDAAVGGHGYISTTVHDVYTGTDLIKMAHRPGAQMVTQEFFRANRFRLREFLMKGRVNERSPIDVRFQHVFEGYEVLSDKKGVVAKFANGERVEGSILVAADGVHSTVRKLVLPQILPSVLHSVTFNGIINLPRKEFDTTSLGTMMEKNNVYIGMGDLFNISLAVNDQTDSEVELSWSYSRPIKSLLDPESDTLYERNAEDPNMIKEAFFDEIATFQPSLASPFAEIFASESIRKTVRYQWVMRSIRCSREDLIETAWQRSGLVVLIGDAAHAMPIFAGEGGNHGLLDGVQLGDLIAEHSKNQDEGMNVAIQTFYDGALERWSDALDGSEKRLNGLNQPIQTWRKMAAAKAAVSEEK